MRGVHRIGLALCVVTLASASMGQARQKSVRTALEPMYRKIEQAFMKRDINMFMALTAPGFTGKSGDETATADKVRMELGMQFAMLKEMKSAKMRISKLTLQGSKAVVVNEYAFSGIIEPQKGTTVTMADKGITRDTWTKTAEGWRLLQLETVKSNPTLDGKPLKEAMSGKSASPGK